MERKKYNIYIYIWKNLNTVYIGRTINPKSRHYQHTHRPTDNVYKFSVEHGVEHPKMVIIENDLTIEEGVEREKYWIKEYRENSIYNVLNKSKGGSIGNMSSMTNEEREIRKEIQKEKARKRTKDWTKLHKEEKKEYDKLYRQSHKEEIKERIKIWRETHKEEKKEYDKLYRQSHKEEIKRYKDINKEKLDKQNKEYRDANREERNRKQKEYYQKHKERYREYSRKNIVIKNN